MNERNLSVPVNAMPMTAPAPVGGCPPVLPVTGSPMIVDEKSMQDFIRVTADADASLLYLDNPDVVLEKGQRVEIIFGPFKGVDGHILSIRRNRRVVISINNIIAVAMATMPCEWLGLKD